MITILTRILPYDISEYIYIFYKTMVIDDIMIPKLYTFEMILDKLIRIYSNPVNTLIGPNYDGFKLIVNVLQVIKKYEYKLDCQLQTKIDKIRELIKHLILINTNTMDCVYNNLLVKLL